VTCTFASTAHSLTFWVRPVRLRELGVKPPIVELTYATDRRFETDKGGSAASYPNMDLGDPSVQCRFSLIILETRS